MILSDSSDFQTVLNLLLAVVAAATFILCFFLCLFVIYKRLVSSLSAQNNEYNDPFLDEETSLDSAEMEALLQSMSESARDHYLRAQDWIQRNQSLSQDISLSQYMSIQEKGVSAWEFEPDLHLTNSFVDGRTELTFYDSECCIQTNLPLPKQNDVYYWEAKMFDMPDNTLVSIGLATKPYPPFRLPGLHRHSIAYISNGTRRISQPFTAKKYGQPFQQGDVVGVGFRPRSGHIFFTLNGLRFSEFYMPPHLILYPSVGAMGPCTVHVNLGQGGFVYLDANIKKWGLAPMVGTLGAPPAYGVEHGSILLESNTHQAWQRRNRPRAQVDSEPEAPNTNIPNSSLHVCLKSFSSPEEPNCLPPEHQDNAIIESQHTRPTAISTIHDPPAYASADENDNEILR